MRIGILGGTGKQGRGLAMRWGHAGHEVIIGSRDTARAVADAAALEIPTVRGASNLEAARCEVVVVSVPYRGHRAVLEEVGGDIAPEAIVIDLVVPLSPPVDKVSLPEGQSAALEARAILGDSARLVAALHHVSSAHLADLDHELPGHVLVCGDDRAAVDAVIELIGGLGIRGVDAGALVNSIALESLTPVLIHMNKRYKKRGLGLFIAGLDP